MGTKPAFRELIAEDLQRLGLTPSGAARKAGLDHHTILDLIRGQRRPRKRTILRLIDSMGLDPGRYNGFLTSSDIIFVCPDCGKPRPSPRHQLRWAAEGAKGGRELRQRPDGTYELRCAQCARRKTGREQIGRLSAFMLTKTLGGRVATEVLRSAAEGEEWAQGELREERLDMLGGERALAANQAKFRSWIRRPQGEKHRRLKSRVRVAMVRLRKPFYLCPLCELVSWGNRWHLPCLHAWLRQRKHKLGHGWSRIVPPASRHRGPRPERNLLRNYRWMMARRMGQATRRELLNGNLTTKATVTNAIRAFIGLLPGSWDLVFRRPVNTRRANRTRQEFIPLPLELHHIIETGRRDPLIKRLHGFGMSVEDIAEITGASIHRARAVLGLRDQEKRFSPPGWVARVINARLGPHFALCPVCGLVLYGIRSQSRRSGSCLHGPCWRLLLGMPGHRRNGRWLSGNLGSVGNGFEGRVQKNPRSLLACYQALLRFAASKKRSGIPANVTRPNLSKKVMAFVELLPGSWDYVFRDKNLRRANQVRQDFFPLPAHHGDRTELVRRLSAMAMRNEDIAKLTGVPLAMVEVRSASPDGIPGR